jgi:hypothetical protein
MHYASLESKGYVLLLLEFASGESKICFEPKNICLMNLFIYYISANNEACVFVIEHIVLPLSWNKWSGFI